ncbi:MAG: glycosyltransferase family 2 protein [Planctomycetes bacterium]|nr:glycosyltransferase family 2 protein [Planctomycetota bacterium]
MSDTPIKMDSSKNRQPAGPPRVSIVVPLFNERDNITELTDNITSVMDADGVPYEIIMVDDGSSDDTIELLCDLQKKHPCIRIVQFRRNFGQTAAIAAGFDHARGQIIIPLDGDLQNDPADIPRLIEKLNEGYDVVSGWRKNRKDKLLTRKIPSWIANYVIGKITGVKLHDYGCTLKAYRREVIQHINLYGEMHRFIPALAKWSGATVTELEVNHRPRIHGVTKYGLSRTVKVILDLVTVKFLGTFSTKPLHVFGGIGILSMLFSMITGAIVIYQKWFHQADMSGNPLLLITALLIMMSVQFLLMGLLAELMVRTYHESQDKPTYVIRRVIEPTKDKPYSGKERRNVQDT